MNGEKETEDHVQLVQLRGHSVGFSCSSHTGDGEAEFHFVGKLRNELARNEKGGEIEQVDEDFISITEREEHQSLRRRMLSILHLQVDRR